MSDSKRPTWQLTDERLRALAKTSAVLWITSADGKATFENPSWTAFTGQSHAEYIGWGWVNAIHPDDRAPIAPIWRESLRLEQSVKLQYRLRRHDGEYRLMNAEGTPLRTAGRIAEWIGYAIDVTESVKMQAALMASEERFRFLDALGERIRGLTDPSQILQLTTRLLGEHLHASGCRYADVERDNDSFTIRTEWSAPQSRPAGGVFSLSAFGAKRVKQLEAGEYWVIEDSDALEDSAPRRLYSSQMKAVVWAPLVKEGRLLALLAVHHSAPRQWTPDEIGLIGEVVDRCWAHIERVRYASMLEEQDRRKDEFLATLAHELRNPLAPIRYAISIMRSVPPGAAERMDAQSIIERQVGFMARLVDDLLDLSRINRGLIELKKEPLALASVIAQAVETSRHSIESAHHRLELALPTSELRIDADRARIVQVISNLLNNAAKYTPDGGLIHVSARAEEGHAVIEVRDTGIGIPPEQQTQLFEMFTQLPHAAERSQGGLGIGLALVRRLVQLHCGHIRVFSAGLDQGSTFTLELPLSDSNSIAERPSSEPSQPVCASAAVKRVLVVEDNRDGLAALTMLLELMGFDVAAASDGEMGLAMAHEFQPQVGILDLGLPKMDGLSLARELRADPRHRDMKLIALTGWGAAQDRERTEQAGFDHHLTKPVEPKQLEALLQGLEL